MRTIDAITSDAKLKPVKMKARGVTNKVWLGRVVFWVLMVGVSSVGFVVTVLNIQPYRILLRNAIASMVPGIMGWPLVQEIVFVLGFFLFAALQIFEVLPTLIKKSRTSVLAILSDIQSTPGDVAIRDDDTALVKKLKRALNDLPEETVKILFRLKSWAYLVDGIICWSVFPPIVEGARLVGFNLFTDINWPNAALMVATIIVFEIVCNVISTVWSARHWIRAIGK